jgi:starvation-inducible DNA-binding protein
MSWTKQPSVRHCWILSPPASNKVEKSFHARKISLIRSRLRRRHDTRSLYQNLPKFAAIDWAPVGSTAILAASVETNRPHPDRQSAAHSITGIGTLIDVILDHQFATGTYAAVAKHEITTRKEISVMPNDNAKTRRTAPLDTPSNLGSNARHQVSAALTTLLADMFALYVKTKNFHWHVSGPHFRDYHLMLDEQGSQIFATTDDIAERVRKLGGTTIRSIGHIARLQRVSDNDADFVTAQDMLSELRDDNIQLTARLRETHSLCDEHQDVATASLIENWIDEAEKRTWFLFEATRHG